MAAGAPTPADRRAHFLSAVLKATACQRPDVGEARIIAQVCRKHWRPRKDTPAMAFTQSADVHKALLFCGHRFAFREPAGARDTANARGSRLLQGESPGAKQSVAGHQQLLIPPGDDLGHWQR